MVGAVGVSRRGWQVLREVKGRGRSFSLRKAAPDAVWFTVSNCVGGAWPEDWATSADCLGECFSGVPLRAALSIRGEEDRAVVMAAGGL